MRALLAMCLLFATSLSAAPANRCSDPYWKDALRCVFFPNEVPQPNADQIPQLAKNAEVPPFTRGFLENENVR